LANNEPIDDDAPWLSVIGKALAYLCLDKARERDPDKFGDVLNKVDFLQGLGLPEKDAAEAAGTTIKSVRELRRHHGRKRASSGKAKKTRRRR
jgi:hypothetical protein